MNKKLSFIIIFSFFISFYKLYAIGFSIKSFKFQKRNNIKIIADVLSYNKKKKLFIAEGNVIAYYGGLKLNCNRLFYYKNENRVIAIGNVRIISENGEIRGKKITLNLQNKTGVIENGEIYLKDKALHLRGEKIIKTENDEYKFKNCTLTSCNFFKPFWAFTAKEATVTKEGKTKAKNIRFKVKDYTLFYLPRATLPGRSSRNSGFLIPSVSLSDKFGLRYKQGYYFVINPSMDSTFYYDLMSKRGIKTGLEFRYKLTENAKGWIKGFYLYDTGIDSKDYAIRDSKKNRYLFNLHHEQLTENNIKIYSNVYLTGDINYIYDFPKDFSKVDRRNFESRNNINSTIFLNKNFFDTFNTTVESEWRKSLLSRKNTRTTQKLIDFNFYSTPISILERNIYQDIKFNYGNYYRKNGDKLVRLYFSPEFSKNILNSELKIRPVLAQYFYEISNNKNTKSRIYLKLNYNVETQFSKVFNFYLFNIAKFEHIVEPEVEYSFISYPSEVPVFDILDMDRKKNVITYHLKNKIIAKNYQEKFYKLIDWDIYQSFQLQKYSYLYNDKRFSNIFSDFKFELWPYAYVENQLEYNPYENYLQRFNLLVSANVLNYLTLNYDYRFLKREINQMSLGLNGNILDTWTLYFKINYDYLIDEYNTITYGVTYHPQCWSLDFNIKQEKNPDDISVNFNISLKGLD